MVDGNRGGLKPVPAAAKRLRNRTAAASTREVAPPFSPGRGASGGMAVYRRRQSARSACSTMAAACTQKRLSALPSASTTCRRSRL